MKDIKNIIYEYLRGDKEYWRNRMKKWVCDEINTNRLIIYGCDCEGCTQKYYFGCYNLEFNRANKRGIYPHSLIYFHQTS